MKRSPALWAAYIQARREEGGLTLEGLPGGREGQEGGGREGQEGGGRAHQEVFASEVRELYEQGLIAAGSSWEAQELWQSYIQFEEDEIGDFGAADLVYSRAVKVPMQGLLELLDSREEDQEEAEDAQAERSRREVFEDELEDYHCIEEILDKSENDTWTKYINYVKEFGSPEEVESIYERWLSRCPWNPEVWIDLAEYQKKCRDERDVIRNTYETGFSFLPESLELIFKYSEFEEEGGKYSKAHEVLGNIKPEVDMLLARAKVEQRAGNMEEALNFFKEAYSKAGTNVAQLSQIALKMSLFCRTQEDLVTAVGTLSDALQVDVNNPKLYRAKLEIMKSFRPSEAISVCDEAIKSNMKKSDKVGYLVEKVEIVEALGLQTSQLRAAQNEMQLLVGFKAGGNEKLVKNVACDMCMKLFVSVRNLEVHKVLKHEGQEKCDKCYNNFDDKNLLDQHRKSCPWVCSKCQFSSMKRSNLKRHEKKVHK